MGVSLRAPSPRWSQRIRGAASLLLLSPMDRLANRVAPRRWYRWKAGLAERRAARLPGPGGPSAAGATSA